MPDSTGPSGHQRTVPLHRDALVLILLGLLTVAVCLPLFTKFPAPGGDEPGFVDAATRVATHGRIATDVFGGLLPGAERHIYWQPPLYFVVLGGWFRVVGIGLVQARMLSFVSAVMVVLGVYLVSRQQASVRNAAIAGSLCALSFWLTVAACTARMDALCVALVLGCVLARQRAQAADARGAVRLMAVSGLLAGLAATTHPLGMIGVAAVLGDVVLGKRPAPVTKSLAAFAGCFAVCLAAWAVYALQDPAAFRLQMAAQFARKLQGPSYWTQFWMAKTHVATLVVALATAAWLLVRGWRSGLEIVVTAFVVAFVAATWGNESGYFLYFFPFACSTVAVALERAASSTKRVLYAGLVLAFANELLIFGNNVRRYHQRSYADITVGVRAAIPPGAVVFIGFAEVSPYFALAGRNPIRIAVPVPVADANAHRRLAATADFIAVSPGVAYLPDVASMLEGTRPIARFDQGPGFRLDIFARRPDSPARVLSSPVSR